MIWKALEFLSSKVFCFLWQISPEDIQWDGEDPGISRHGGYAGSGHVVGRSVGRGGPPAGGRGRGSTKGQPKKDFAPSQNGIGKKGLDEIQILHTDTLIKEVSAKQVASLQSSMWSYLIVSPPAIW